MGATLIAYLLQMGGWMLIMRRLGIVLSPLEVIHGYTFSFLPRYIPGSVWGYLGRSQWLAQRHNVSYPISTLGSLLEAGYLILTSLLVGGSYLLTSPFAIGHGASMGLNLVGLGIGFLLIVGYAVWQFGPRLLLSPKGLFAQFDAMPSLSFMSLRKSIYVFGAVIASYIGLWFLQGWATMWAAQAIGSTEITWAEATSATSLAWTMGFIVLFVPAGLGVREASLVTFLQWFGISVIGSANLIATATRIVLFGTELLWLTASGVVYLLSKGNGYYFKTLGK